MKSIYQFALAFAVLVSMAAMPSAVQASSPSASHTHSHLFHDHTPRVHDHSVRSHRS